MAPVLSDYELLGWFTSKITPRCRGLRRSGLGSTDRPPIRSSRWLGGRGGSVGESSCWPLARRSCSAPARCGLALEVTAGRARARRCPGSLLQSSVCLRSLQGKFPERVAPGGNRGQMGLAAGFDEHRDLVRPRQPRGAPRTELLQLGSDRPPLADRASMSSCLCARGTQPRAIRSAWLASPWRRPVETRPTRTRSSTAAPAEHDRMPLRSVLLSESKAGRGAHPCQQRGKVPTETTSPGRSARISLTAQ